MEGGRIREGKAEAIKRGKEKIKIVLKKKFKWMPTFIHYVNLGKFVYLYIWEYLWNYVYLGILVGRN